MNEGVSKTHFHAKTPPSTSLPPLSSLLEGKYPEGGKGSWNIEFWHTLLKLYTITFSAKDSSIPEVFSSGHP